MTADPGSRPSISVVIAAFDAASTLPAQLDALRSQQVGAAWEVLVCDNGSRDGTAAVAHEYQARMAGLRLVDASARRGPGAARNAGARAAAARLLAFCDADDVVAPGWVQAMLDALQTATLVTGTSRRPEFNARPGAEHTFAWNAYRLPFLPYLPAAGAGNLGVRRDAFLAVGGFDETMRAGEDVDLCWRMQLAGHPLVVEPRAVVLVSNRSGLAGTISQTFGYGVGDRRLAHRYALVADAYRRRGPTGSGVTAQDAAAAPSPSTSASVISRVGRKLRSLRRPSDLTLVVRRIAAWAGFRLTVVPRGTPQTPVPHDLPATW